MLTYLKLYVVSVVDFDFGVFDFFNHFPQRDGHFDAAFGHAAEVDGEVGARSSPSPLLKGDDQVIVVGSIAQ